MGWSTALSGAVAHLHRMVCVTGDSDRAVLVALYHPSPVYNPRVISPMHVAAGD